MLIKRIGFCLSQLLLFIVLFSPSDMNAQEIVRVTGTVQTQNNSPLADVSVNVEGKSEGTVTAPDGTFSINTEKNSTLLFSMIGYQPQRVIVDRDGQVIAIQMESSSAALDEVTVVGYGTQKKANLTGAVASVSAATLSASPVPNPANLLQGRLPGLEVIQPSGRPGNDDPMLRIRGMGSFGASSAPLVLIDGIIGTINSVAPNDIESVTVLKDAASASIYGARAANGVILINTKKAKRGAASLEYNLDIGFQNATSVRELIWNSGEYMEMYNAARTRSGLTPFYTQDQIDDYKNATDRTLFPNYNWPENIFKTATIYNHSLSFSKATETSKFRLGLNYID